MPDSDRGALQTVLLRIRNGPREALWHSKHFSIMPYLPVLTYYNFVDSQDEDALFEAEAVLPGEELWLASCWDKHPPGPLSLTAATEAGVDGSSECYINMERNTAFGLKLEGRRGILCEGGDLGYFFCPRFIAMILLIKSC